VPDLRQTPRIYVLAGVNGAGKSSVGGAMLAEAGIEFYNPDSAAREFHLKLPGISQEEANGLAWQQGRRLLEKAIDAGIEVRIWYVGLESADLHIARVRSRVAMGGHDIPEAKIRERYARSRMKLIELLPHLAELKVFDNTEEGDPQKGQAPSLKLLLHTKWGRIVSSSDLSLVPPWAKPILQAAIGSSGKT
jgi:predicted ABC-type ATPase